MKKQRVLWAALVGCAICLTACGDKNKKDIDTDGGTSSVQEYAFQSETETPQETASQDARSPRPKDGYASIKSKAKVEFYGGTIKIGDTAYELYNYVESTGKQYAKVVNHIANALDGVANVYDMVIPTSVGITLPDNKKSKINSSDQKDSIKKIYNMTNHKVKAVDLFDTMMQHRQEYIYFRTDHHWTDKGAYYAYQKYCSDAGLIANELSDYQTASFGGYLGSFYTDTDQNKKLRKDHVKAFFPINYDAMSMTYVTESGSKVKSALISDATNYSTFMKYYAFLVGDNSYTVVRNKNVKDGSSCLVVKESFGNTLVPYLADHYAKVYVVDYRYWKGSVVKFAKDKGVKDVLFANNISMTRNAYLVGKLAKVQ